MGGAHEGKRVGPSCKYGQKNFIQNVERRKENKSVDCLSFPLCTVKLLCIKHIKLRQTFMCGAAITDYTIVVIFTLCA